MTFARKRHSSGNAWVYDDPAVDRAITSLLLTHGLDVSRVDDWIESDDSPWDEASRRAVTINRGRLIDAKLAGNDEAVFAWVEYFRLALYSGQMQVKLHPLARLGQWVDGKVPPGEKATLYRPMVSDHDRNDRKAKAKVMRAQGSTKEEIAAALGVSLGTVTTDLKRPK